MQNFVVFLFICNLFARGHAKCEEGWFEYNNEKCYKILEDFVTKENAVSICTAEQTVSDIPKLLEIQTATEQEFVSSLIFDQSEIFDNVWLGATRYNATNFQGSDGTSLVYSNWLNGIPSNDVTNNCSQLSSGVSKEQVITEAGSWADVPCSKRNLVVCQTSSTLSLKQLQDVVYEIRNNPVPIGFIYTEYPDQSSPQQIWPSLVWESVTSKYAGHFFRAEGGDSANFGASQSDNSPRLKSVAFEVRPDPPNYSLNVTIPVGSLSNSVCAGIFTSGELILYEGLRFETTGGEVRPINQAVRIWQRVG